MASSSQTVFFQTNLFTVAQRLGIALQPGEKSLDARGRGQHDGNLLANFPARIDVDGLGIRELRLDGFAPGVLQIEIVDGEEEVVARTNIAKVEAAVAVALKAMVLMRLRLWVTRRQHH